MTTFQEIIMRVDGLVPNAYTDDQKLRWLAELDRKIASEIFQWDVAEIRALPRDYPDAMMLEPLVTEPYGEMYDQWLTAKIHAADQEVGRYENAAAFFRETYGDFRLWFCDTYQSAYWDLE